MVIALMIGAVACSSSDADTTNVGDGTTPAGTNSTPSTDADTTKVSDSIQVSKTDLAPATDAAGTEPSEPTVTPPTGTEPGKRTVMAPTEAELLTTRDLAMIQWNQNSATQTWTTETYVEFSWDNDVNDAYFTHTCGFETATLRQFPQFAGLEHVDQVVGAWRGGVAETVFAGTSETLADVYEAATDQLSECLANPQESIEPDSPLTDDGYDVAATLLPPLGLGRADFSMRQQIVDLCDHRLALVLTDTRLVVVELNDYSRSDQFTNGDFRAVVDSAVRRAAA